MLTTLIASLAVSPLVGMAAKMPSFDPFPNRYGVVHVGNDNTFSNTYWTFTCLTYGSGVTVTSTVHSTGGNTGGSPDPWHDTYIWFTTSRTLLGRGVMLAEDSQAVWTPNNFDYVTMNEDLQKLQVGSDIWPGILIKQNGTYYLGPGNPTTLTLNTWVAGAQASGYASDFNELNTSDLTVNTSSHPDLSNTGADVEFGFYYAGSRVLGVYAEGETGTDNWVLDVHTNPAPAHRQPLK
jgi:hypothetical protein